MAKNTKIGWTTHTYNHWTGCSKVSAGCVNCYAEEWSLKTLGRTKWGPGQERPQTKTHGNPIHWNKVAGLRRQAWEAFVKQCNPGDNVEVEWVKHSGTPPPKREKVFSMSLADWLDAEVPIETFCDFLDIVRKCTELDWLLLSKRIVTWEDRMRAALEYLTKHDKDIKRGDELGEWIYNWAFRCQPPPHIWIGTTIENQKAWDERSRALVTVPAVFRFISIEPQLEHIQFGPTTCHDGGLLWPLEGIVWRNGQRDKLPNQRIHWVIVGGESGRKRRPFEVDWIHSIYDECRKTGAALFVKQDGHLREGQQGRIPDAMWKIKQYPDEPDTLCPICRGLGIKTMAEQVVPYHCARCYKTKPEIQKA